MAKLQLITVKESPEELTNLLSKSSYAIKPRIKMLLAINQGIISTQDLVNKTKSNRNSILNWKTAYRLNGLQGLLEDSRGGKRPAAINATQKNQLEKKLSNPKEGFTSYIQAVDWINETFGLKMNYHAVNKYLKRNFGTKLKVGRKTHINKDDNAAALFKKTI
jgi:transposase